MMFFPGILDTNNYGHPEFYFMNSDKTYICKFHRGVQLSLTWLALPSVTGTIRDFSHYGDTFYLLVTDDTIDQVTVYRYTGTWSVWCQYTTDRGLTGYWRIEANQYACLVYCGEFGQELDIVDSDGNVRKIYAGFAWQYLRHNLGSMLWGHYRLGLNVDWANTTPDHYDAYSDPVYLASQITSQIDDEINYQCIGESPAGDEIYWKTGIYGAVLTSGGLESDDFDQEGNSEPDWVIGTRGGHHFENLYFARAIYEQTGYTITRLSLSPFLTNTYPAASIKSRILLYDSVNQTLRYFINERQYITKGLLYTPFKITL